MLIQVIVLFFMKTGVEIGITVNVREDKTLPSSLKNIKYSGILRQLPSCFLYMRRGWTRCGNVTSLYMGVKIRRDVTLGRIYHWDWQTNLAGTILWRLREGYPVAPCLPVLVDPWVNPHCNWSRNSDVGCGNMASPSIPSQVGLVIVSITTFQWRQC